MDQYVINTKRNRSRKRTPPRPELVQGMTKQEYVSHHINELLDYVAQLKEQEL